MSESSTADASAPEPRQRHCVYQWAHRNHLTLVVINAVNQPQTPPNPEPKS